MRKAFVSALLLTLAVAGGLLIWTHVGKTIGDKIPEKGLRPPGAWNLGQPLSDVGPGDPDQLARLLALPYAAGEKLATAPGLGVVVHDPKRTQPGVNFYVSGHAPEAILIDMEGAFLHRWKGDFRVAFPNRASLTEAGLNHFRRAVLLPDGDVIALWHGGGLTRLDLRSRIVWVVDLGFYNDLYYRQEGNGREMLVALHKTAEHRPQLGEEPVLNDQLLWIDPGTGEILRRLSLLDAIIESEWAPLLVEEHPDPADLLHANTITVLGEEMVEGSPFEPGWILTSMREISLVAVVDPEANDGRGEIVWGLHGPFVRQHEPVLLPGGELLVFDNQGIDKERARVLRLSLNGEILWRYPDPKGTTADRTLASKEVGVVTPLANGNLLVIESLSGRAIELTPDDEIVWQFETPHRTGDRGRFIATLMDLERLPRPEWLPASGLSQRASQ